MPSGRIFRFIGFNGGENADEVCTSAPKKLMIGRILAEVIFEGPAASINLSEAFFSYFNVSSDS